MSYRHVCLMIALLVAISSDLAFAGGFTLGQLLITSHDKVHLLDTTTGDSEILVEGQTFLRDIVYNPVSESAFVLRGNGLLSEMLELTWDIANGYQTSTFLTGLHHAGGLEVDRFGNIYFGDSAAQNSVDYHILRVTPAGKVSLYADGPFGTLFTPNSLAFSPDESKLYVATSPQNDIDVINSFDRGFTKLTTGLDFPSAVATAADGTVFIAEDFLETRIALFPNGTGPSHTLEFPWMDFSPWTDFAYDDSSETLFVNNFNPRGLYGIHTDGTYTEISSAPFNIFGMDVITAVPEPNTITLAAMTGGLLLVSFGYRSRGRKRIVRIRDGLAFSRSHYAAHTFFHLCLISSAFWFSSNPISAATIEFFTDEAAWLSQVKNIETLFTTPENIRLANEVDVFPGRNADLGSDLTFESASTGLLRSFRLSSINVRPPLPRGLVFRDGESALGGARNISIGDADGVRGSGLDRPPYENDDFEITIIDGPSLKAFAFTLYGNNSSFDESLAVLSGNNELALFSDIPFHSSGQRGQFVGVVSHMPFDRVVFDEDYLGGNDDDIAILDFRFAQTVPEPHAIALALFGGIWLVIARRNPLP